MNDDKAGRPTRAALAACLFAVTVAAAVGLAIAFRPRGLAAVPLIVVPIASYLWYIREMNRRTEATGCASPALLRYTRRMARIAILYVAALFGAVWAAKTYAPAGPLAWLLALVPAVPVLAMVWAMARLLIEEQDEYLRARMVSQGLFATGCMLAVVTVWGFLETFRLVPHVPAYGAFIVWCMGLALGGLWQKLRAA